jgi:asparagine N-glycosylation enzyme membrane subunit Stt3
MEVGAPVQSTETIFIARDLSDHWAAARFLTYLEQFLRRRRSLAMLVLAALVGAFVATFLASNDFIYVVTLVSILAGLFSIGVSYIAQLNRLLSAVVRSAEENGREIDDAMHRLQFVPTTESSQ